MNVTDITVRKTGRNMFNVLDQNSEARINGPMQEEKERRQKLPEKRTQVKRIKHLLMDSSNKRTETTQRMRQLSQHKLGSAKHMICIYKDNSCMTNLKPKVANAQRNSELWNIFFFPSAI